MAESRPGRGLIDQTFGRTMLRRPLEQWYADPLSCLQACLGAALIHVGADPLETLGLSWEFRYKPGDVRREEFYYPGRFADDPAHSIAPHHPIRSEWWSPEDSTDPLRALSIPLSENRPVIVAVDNYHLPFRPAFHDVHAAHLIMVAGVDPGRDEVTVFDPTPPGFDGEIPTRDFLNAWGSANPSDVQDVFFSSSRIGRRCLTVRLTSPVPPLDRATFAAALRHDLAAFRTGSAEANPEQNGAWTGLAGLRAYLSDLTERSGRGDADALADAYPFGWAVQAQAYLHAELLRTLGVRWKLPSLREASRRVAAVSHAWTGLRMTAGHGRNDPAVSADLGRHAGRLLRRHEEAVEELGRVEADIEADIKADIEADAGTDAHVKVQARAQLRGDVS